MEDNIYSSFLLTLNKTRKEENKTELKDKVLGDGLAGSKGAFGGKFDISCKKGLPMIPSCTVFANSKWRPMVKVESGKW